MADGGWLHKNAFYKTQNSTKWNYGGGRKINGMKTWRGGDQLPPARLFLTASKIEVKSATMRQKDNRSELEKELRVRSIYCLLSWTHCNHSFAIVVT
jgi:hypothetical protein